MPPLERKSSPVSELPDALDGKRESGSHISQVRRAQRQMPDRFEDEKDEIFLEHPGQNFMQVAREVIEAHPEESFCFLNTGLLREKVEILRDHFLPGHPGRVIAYAMKANPKRRIMEIISAEGITDFDCASGTEIEKAKEINPDAGILFNHPVKLVRDIQLAATYGVMHYTVQTHNEVLKILNNAFPRSAADPVEIAVRLMTPNEKAKINLSTKYGAGRSAARSIINDVRRHFDVVPGISIHTGSQNEDPAIFADAIKYMADVARSSGKVKTVNVGGGIPVNYAVNDNFSLREYLEIISRALEANIFGALMKDPKIIIELGRALVGETVDLVIPVLAIEDRGQRTVYINDGVFTSFSDHTIHDWQYYFRTIGHGGRQLSRNLVPFVVFGRTCDSGDTLGEVMLPEDLTAKDHLWVQNAGAYMDSQTTRFNGFEPPKYVSYNP